MKHHFERYCKDIECVENYSKAKADNFIGWCCHHRRETHNSDGKRLSVDISMKELKALGMYWNVSAEELIFMTKEEHLSLHHQGNHYMLGKCHSTESRRKMSKAWNYDKHFTKESRKKLSEAAKGKHWYNNGKENKFCFECPDGFLPGRLIL